ncbi:hypothetical protein GRI38_01415 [Altererythrobacter aurantiacus]|uniref:Uncharacterized protein n=1 Tax=Parapontixanthobacter aurantiacus TaxID=1463599 RepID=A0A844ZC27_9SPHN|nr:hypothetical protein [Parapontixanthobacter aurantiacus]
MARPDNAADSLWISLKIDGNQASIRVWISDVSGSFELAKLNLCHAQECKKIK